jgi:hypothetical protein
VELGRHVGAIHYALDVAVRQQEGDQAIRR